ncbi:AMP phosphorylase [Methanocella arvoryzae]|uniref:AMP phosphorylase n=1 Tax=Methanocella arvoryzae (strain DSM 22066 / NBRC 105507 / MRE50) TaxID=351160 RepID=AMPPA_METAR|nr:AMP phosphorylase [Methanocella arvoryzae]Q0W5A8.1 RecName: Full=AMP phosphorylase; Short=AMPpase; AltName: Full=Nucleoside monophosphate phosphorylase; Short=NMP phosphorylase [Methanocella arvoryzae MRE50]CAJ36435.1 putative thymidine phosphorylase [Methanocella arvoryzae MRE50]
MKLRAQPYDIEVGRYEVIINSADAEELGVLAGDRVQVKDKDTITAVVETTDAIVSPGKIGIYREAWESIKVVPDEVVEVLPAAKPKSVSFIRKKMDKQKLTSEEMHAIIEDIVDGNLTEVELTAFVTASYIYTMDSDEIEWMTRAMVKTGDQISFDVHPVMDHHSIGGVPGNKISLCIVPIIAAAGLLIPKTSSRAITGAGGSADLMEILCPVSFRADEIKKMTTKVGGCLVWGGATNIAPADDKIINVEYPLSIDPKSQLLASVMAKKFAVGADTMVLDIPCGNETKIPTVQEGRKLARDFMELGDRLGMKIECALTYGGTPLGRAIGGGVEVREAMVMLEKFEGPRSLLEKTIAISGMMLEMGGVAPKNEGAKMAVELVKSGKALQKFKEIIEVQGGDPKVTSDMVPIGDKVATVLSPQDGYVLEISNKRLVYMCRLAGAPHDKGVGVILHKKKGEYVKKGDGLFTLYADKEWKLDAAIKESLRNPIMMVEGMILEKIEVV